MQAGEPKKMEREGSERAYSVGREARRPQAGSLPRAGPAGVFFFLSPQIHVVWKEFFFLGKMGLIWRMQ